ncbi:PDE9A [Symbiodinium sp. CCMP2592]|nr:PDE9A [Symbiodinium sp. CCMP2592]
MARPPVTSAELECMAGMDSLEQQKALEPGQTWREGWYYPVSRVWPMGFSWSSFVAQEELLGLCNDAQLTEQQVLSCDTATPETFDLVFGAATDDVMIFSTAGSGVTSGAASRLDAAMECRGIVRNTAKDVNDSLDATCVGVNLEQGCFLAMPPARCLAVAVAVLHVLSTQAVSPKQLHQLLGVMQWFDLLRRPKLSVYSSVYDFVRHPKDTSVRRVPSRVCAEMAASFLLGVYWLTDLTRPFLPLLSATDASTEFGLGASVARVTSAEARRIARYAEKQGDFVVLDGGTLHGAAARRLGKAHKLQISMRDFVDVFSVRAKHKAHINVLEGEAFVLWLRWLLRTRRHHATRVVVLVDSAVWVGAASKGRSSTQLNRVLRRAAALEMMGDLHVHLVLVPSGENPSDSPSRGLRRRKSKAAT